MMNARSALSGLKHQKEKRNMDYFAGLDVSVKETSVCIVDDTGKIVRETRVASEPEALLQVLTNTIYRFKRVGLEAGPLSQWLYSVLAEAGLPARSTRASATRTLAQADRSNVQAGTSNQRSASEPLRLQRKTVSPDLSIAA
jgi:hypothetical protein